MKIRQCMLFQTVSCNNGRLSFFVGLSEIHAFLAFGVDSLAGGSFAGEPPDKIGHGSLSWLRWLRYR